MANISKITLPDNSQYDIKDNIARGQIENKVDKITGKSLSTNDYTTTEKNKLANIESEANKTIVDSALSSVSENPLQNKIINTALSEKLGTSGDSKNNIITFTTNDVEDSAVTQATGWSTSTALTSGATHANLFNRISTMMKNVRWLYKMLGTTNISALSTEHTITGALSKLNTNMTGCFFEAIVSQGVAYTFTKPSNQSCLVIASRYRNVNGSIVNPFIVAFVDQWGGVTILQNNSGNGDITASCANNVVTITNGTTQGSVSMLVYFAVAKLND